MRSSKVWTGAALAAVAGLSSSAVAHGDAVGYPSAAMAAVVDGSANLRCEPTPLGLIRNCQVVYELPKGYGFGDAALKLAGHWGGLSTAVAPKDITGFTYLLFCLVPGPGGAGAQHPHIIESTRLLAWPSADQVAAAYPHSQTSGAESVRVAVQCSVQLDGSVTGCTARAYPAEPPFEAAAAALATATLKAAPLIVDGEPRSGGSLSTIVQFGPSAPFIALPPPVPTPIARCGALFGRVAGD